MTNTEPIGSLLIRPKQAILEEKVSLLEKLDIYLEFYLNNIEKKVVTEVLYRSGNHPVWTTSYSLLVFPKDFFLNIKCFDKDSLSKDDFMGQAMQDLNSVFRNRLIETTVKLRKEEAIVGEVDLIIEFYSNNDNEDSISEEPVSITEHNEEANSRINKQLTHSVEIRSISSKGNYIKDNIRRVNSPNHPKNLIQMSGSNSIYNREIQAEELLSPLKKSSDQFKSKHNNPLCVNLNDSLRIQKEQKLSLRSIREENSIRTSQSRTNPLLYDFKSVYSQSVRSKPIKNSVMSRSNKDGSFISFTSIREEKKRKQINRPMDS